MVSDARFQRIEERLARFEKRLKKLEKRENKVCGQMPTGEDEKHLEKVLLR